jgi:hypothetical protein
LKNVSAQDETPKLSRIILSQKFPLKFIIIIFLIKKKPKGKIKNLCWKIEHLLEYSGIFEYWSWNLQF